MAEHTPGPWVLEYDDNFDPYDPGREWPRRITDEVGVPITDFRGGSYVSDADAHLLAAAPDLLFACEKALILGEEAGLDIRYGGWAKIRAAIAKAKGEAP